MSPEKTLAIIDKPVYGVGDRGRVALHFSVYVTESSAALQVFEDSAAIAEILTAYGVRDVKDLHGKPCWVDTSKPGLIAWAGPWKKR
ncbi:MAG TPA: hypothetical protein VGF95_14285 [Solirubrobacteraceae bacterium]